LGLVAEGLTDSEIAAELGLEVDSVHETVAALVERTLPVG
jgi:DNA-binding NarL/FixJ family response regulator